MNPSSSTTSLLLSVQPEEKSRRKQLSYSSIYRPAAAAPKLTAALTASAKRVNNSRHVRSGVTSSALSPRSMIPTIFSYMMTTTRHSQLGKYSTLCLLLIFAAASATAAERKSDGEQKLAGISANQEQGILPAEFAEMCAKFPALTGCRAQEVEKRKSAYMRFGRSPQIARNEDGEAYDNFEKRKSAYMRFGKRFSPYEAGEFEQFSAIPDMDKRKSAYMRFGKRKSAYMRFGKRADMDEYEKAMEKRKSAYMRFGKRSLLAENIDDKSGAMEKRKSAYMRFGKK